MSNTVVLEGFVWFISMMLVGALSLFFASKLHSMNVENAAMPRINSTEGSRLFLLFGINYIVVGIACVILTIWADPIVLSRLNNILHEWWLVEIFIFFNLITSYCLYTAIKRVIVNV